MRLNRLSKPSAGTVLPLALVTGLLTFSCSKTTTYSYVDVSVQVDPSVPMKDLAATLDSCEVQVSGAESVEGVVIPCVPNAKIGYDLGTFEWTTTLEKGQLVFTVTLFALNRAVYGSGTSTPVDIVAGKRVSSSVIVVVTPTTMPGTGGAGGGAGGGSGTGGVGGTSGGGGKGGAGAVGGQGGSSTGGAGGTVGQGGAEGGKSGTAGAGGSGQSGAGGSSAGGASGSAGSSAGGTSGSAGAGGVTGTAGAGGAANGGSAGGAGGA
jgi:hypothetical protein